MAKRKQETRQLAFDFEQPELEPKALVQKLIDAGLIANEFHFDLNHGVLGDWCERPDACRNSRAFIFPVRLNLQADGGPRLELRAPFRQAPPLVARAEAALGMRAAWYGETGPMCARWHHAVDLCTNEHWRDLMATREITTKREIASAVALHLQWGALSLENARTILETLGIEEPDDRSDVFLFGPNGLRPCRTNGAPNLHVREPVHAWAAVHAIEDGWIILPKKKNAHRTVSAKYWHRVDGEMKRAA